MGAYYRYEFKNIPNDKRGMIEPFTSSKKILKALSKIDNNMKSGRDYDYSYKFLETFYYNNYFTNLLYLILLDYHRQQFLIHTVCDYDEEKAFKEWIYKKPAFEESDNFVKITDAIQKQEDKRIIELFNDRMFLDYKIGALNEAPTLIIINKEKKQYLNLAKFKKESTKRKWLIDPIALLTRSTQESRGGGDFYELEARNNPLPTSWKNDILYAAERLNNEEKSFEDISEKIMMTEY